MYHDLNLRRRILLNLSPSDARLKALKVISTPLIEYLDPDFLEIMNETIDRRKYYDFAS